ncbi:hypothetical protein GCM10009665_80550 [Kitasatospora nipponensis]|uniref:Uncharacterized protein n=1 Tax=Kitasatospora nipponensis TaxID=258049 RepID=A0ABN1TGZ5_9ACTN
MKACPRRTVQYDQQEQEGAMNAILVHINPGGVAEPLAGGPGPDRTQPLHAVPLP